jgi:hypothetical protein
LENPIDRGCKVADYRGACSIPRIQKRLLDRASTRADEDATRAGGARRRDIAGGIADQVRRREVEPQLRLRLKEQARLRFPTVAGIGGAVQTQERGVDAATRVLDLRDDARIDGKDVLGGHEPAANG